MNNFQAISESRRKKKLLVVVMRIDLTNTSRKKTKMNVSRVQNLNSKKQKIQLLVFMKNYAKFGK